jgi:hypothetical protein
MQEFSIENKAWKLNLVKNPAGGNVTLSEYVQSAERKQLIFCLNDELADGEDISWIWDIDLEMANKKEVELYIASGKRAYDAALRMKYAGFPEDKIMILPDMSEAVLHAKSKGLPAYIIARYTCLTPMVNLLTKEANMYTKEDAPHGISILPFLSKYLKLTWGQGKHHLLKKTVPMERNHHSDRRNKIS